MVIEGRVTEGSGDSRERWDGRHRAGAGTERRTRKAVSCRTGVQKEKKGVETQPGPQDTQWAPES